MLIVQHGLCAICKKEMKLPQVDHDHKTNRVRGLLCSRCNVRLATVEDANFLKLALAYLNA